MASSTRNLGPAFGRDRLGDLERRPNEVAVRGQIDQAVVESASRVPLTPKKPHGLRVIGVGPGQADRNGSDRSETVLRRIVQVEVAAVRIPPRPVVR